MEKLETGSYVEIRDKNLINIINKSIITLHVTSVLIDIFDDDEETNFDLKIIDGDTLFGLTEKPAKQDIYDRRVYNYVPRHGYACPYIVIYSIENIDGGIRIEFSDCRWGESWEDVSAAYPDIIFHIIFVQPEDSVKRYRIEYDVKNGAMVDSTFVKTLIGG